MSTTTVDFPGLEQEQLVQLGQLPSDPSPIRESRGLGRIGRWFRRHKEPDDSVVAIPIGPSLIKRNLRMARPYPPRTLSIGIPGVVMFHIHWNSTRRGQEEGLRFAGNRISFSKTSGLDYFRRRKATRVVNNMMKAIGADGSWRVKGNPKFSSSGSFGYQWISDASKELRRNPFFQRGLDPSKAGVLNRATGKFVHKMPTGETFNPETALTDGFGVPKQSIFGDTIFGPPQQPVDNGWNWSLGAALPQDDQPQYVYPFGPGVGNPFMSGSQWGNYDPYGLWNPNFLVGQAGNQRDRSRDPNRDLADSDDVDSLLDPDPEPAIRRGGRDPVDVGTIGIELSRRGPPPITFPGM